MKHFKIGISAIVLLLAIGTSFAFRTAEAKSKALLTCVWYDYTAAPGNEHDPVNFTLTVSPPPSCPGATNLCAICVDPSEIYGPGGAFPGLPMVDDENTYIKNLIDNALLQFEDLSIEILNTGVELKN
ncbi:hypothetical protein HB364_17210 [Pseudoflavitalea sp. X16]|uniref:DUF6520 family protein n=1 Tax=Paraflavitalea devenefica TaxID=2716334 RepID=UPI001420B937|nr:DUF6520 family protein [Paraflavitalea devenefica]NII26832.1 hypothetical protein [Paraflavitalea devenefica]